MMSWLKIISGALTFFNFLAARAERRKQQVVGKQEAENEALRAEVDARKRWEQIDANPTATASMFIWLRDTPDKQSVEDRLSSISGASGFSTSDVIQSRN